MTRAKNYMIVLTLLLTSLSVNAQEVESDDYRKFPLKVAIGNHSVGFPYQNLFRSSNPCFSIGTELGLNRSERHHLFTSAQIGYINNAVIGNTLTLGVDFGYRYTHKSAVFAEMRLGLGVLDQFHPRDIYEQDPSDGTYYIVQDKGTFSSLLEFNTGIGYDLARNTKVPIRIGLSHNFFMQTVYFDAASFPVMPQTTTSLFLVYKFRKS